MTSYYLFDPTGNITALVDGPYDSKKIMEMEPSCEQLGYFSFDNDKGADINIAMAGGEFCGNATMCAAYMTGKSEVKVYVEGTGMINVTVNGSEFSVDMPKPVEITQINGYPLVRFKGIDHVIIEDDLDPELIKQWCEGDALGFMYLNGDTLKPLVYVKSIGTLLYENSCASGTTAVGYYKGCSVELKQPGGILKFCDGKLTGTVKLLKKVELN